MHRNFPNSCSKNRQEPVLIGRIKAICWQMLWWEIGWKIFRRCCAVANGRHKQVLFADERISKADFYSDRVLLRPGMANSPVWANLLIIISRDRAISRDVEQGRSPDISPILLWGRFWRNVADSSIQWLKQSLFKAWDDFFLDTPATAVGISWSVSKPAERSKKDVLKWIYDCVFVYVLLKNC